MSPNRSRAQRPVVVWLTGLPGAGKSTLACATQAALQKLGVPCVVLDGDALRRGLCADLDFSDAGRLENMRRTAEVAKLLWLQGCVVLVALVSPLRSGREAARACFPEGAFLEVFCDSPLAVCQQRDPKGLYAQAAQGLVSRFTGLTAPYEAPLSPALHLRTGTQSVEESRLLLLDCMHRSSAG